MAAALVASLFAGVQEAAARCDLSHAPPVPVVKNLPYKEARQAILAAGWSPIQGQPHNDLSDNETNFRDRGFAELQFCRLDSDSSCRFAFNGPGGFTLWITTAGDENAALDTQAKVRAAKLACEGDGDPG